MTATSDATAPLIVGVDAHKDHHVAVALNELGQRIAATTASTSMAGLHAVRRGAADLGQPVAWGVEGTGWWGAGLARALQAEGDHVVELTRAERRARRSQTGKSDDLDAEAAALSVLAGFASAQPKTGTGPVEVIRATRTTRASAIKARTAAINQLKALLVTAPPQCGTSSRT